MSDFFDKNLFQQIFAGIVILLIGLLLGKKEKFVVPTRAWKIIIIIAWFMFWGGILLFFVNFSKGGFNNLYTNLGLSLIVLSIPLKYVGKFFV